MARRPPPPADGEAAAASAPAPAKKAAAKKAAKKKKAPTKRQREKIRAKQREHSREWRAQKHYRDPEGNPLCHPYRGKGVHGDGFNAKYLRKVLTDEPGAPRFELTDEGVEMIDEVLSSGGGLGEVCMQLGCKPNLLRHLRFRDKALADMIEDARTFGVKYRLSNLATEQPVDRDSAAALSAQVQAVTRYAETTLPHIYGRRAIEGTPPGKNTESGGRSGWAIVPQKQVAPARAQLAERLAEARDTREPLTLEGEARLVLPTHRSK